ncbi:MAG TPA: helix-turn-helix transcriptional regulator [Pseudonocardiaceae bacterium]|jgi:transcriptional regulator with XRE-family HTH domain
MAASTNELGAMLRRWRDRLSPTEFGLPVTTHRRTSGLRRQEVAQLAGVSLDYLVQLEQGRATTPSPQVLTALTRALRLTETERDHLFRLAEQPVPQEGNIHHTLPHSVRRLVKQMSASPAAVYDVCWNPIAWNAMWAAVMGDPLDRPGPERNMAWRYFTDLPTRVVRSPDERRQYEQTVVADLRSSLGRYPRDPRLARLIAELLDASPRFRDLWEVRDVGCYEQERKLIDHAELGLLYLDCDILTTQRQDFRVVVYTAAPDSESARRLEQLRVAPQLSIR